jgi:hypothetical protein
MVCIFFQMMRGMSYFLTRSGGAYCAVVYVGWTTTACTKAALAAIEFYCTRALAVTRRWQPKMSLLPGIK